MFSKIGDSSPPAPTKKDSVPVFDPAAVRGTTREEGRYKKEGHGKQDGQEEEAVPAGDDTLFSVRAVRALLQQEKVLLSDPVFRRLDLLEKRGVMTVPIRENQSIQEAIATAASYVAAPT